MQSNTELKQQDSADATADQAPVFLYHAATATDPACAGPNENGEWWTGSFPQGRMTYEEAEAAIKACRAGGFDDWRLPPLKKLFGEVDHTKCDPASSSPLRVESGAHWTSTECAWSDKQADGRASLFWIVNFYSGFVLCLHRGNYAIARAVRGGGAPASQ